MADIAVLVYSRGGNTKKVADAIAGALGVEAQDVMAPLPADAKIVFLGSGTYGGKPGDEMMKFIGASGFAGRKVALFGTSSSVAGSEKMIGVMADTVKQKGASVLGSWHCRGKFLFSNRGHPDKEDLENAGKFAQEMLALSKA